jgi:hypothetical protein
MGGEGVVVVNGCVRRAWLTLDGRTLSLEGRGYACQELNLGAPEVRDVTNNRPDADGLDDTTQLMGGRAVSASITALASAGVRIDEIAASFGPFMVPAARPVLHYVLDRGMNEERVLTLRPAAFDFPIAGPFQRDISLSWIAPDPVARDPVVYAATSWAGTDVSGRTYDLTFDRVYPSGAGQPTTGYISGRGDVAIRPYLRIYGPAQSPDVTFVVPPDADTFRVALTGYRIDASHFVGIDTAAHTAYLDDDPAKSILSAIDWTNLRWPVLDPTKQTAMNMAADDATHITQTVATWQDGYLT